MNANRLDSFKRSSSRFRYRVLATSEIPDPKKMIKNIAVMISMFCKDQDVWTEISKSLSKKVSDLGREASIMIRMVAARIQLNIAKNLMNLSQKALPFLLSWNRSCNDVGFLGLIGGTSFSFSSRRRYRLEFQLPLGKALLGFPDLVL